MKTQGITISQYGTLILTWGTIVPLPFWSRLRHHIAKAGMADEFRAEFVKARDYIREGRSAGNVNALEETDIEHTLWTRWVSRVCGPQRIQLWDRGWTPELVDAYPEVTHERPQAAGLGQVAGGVPPAAPVAGPPDAGADQARDAAA